MGEPPPLAISSSSTSSSSSSLLAPSAPRPLSFSGGGGVQIVVPGQRIAAEEGCMRGHGTYVRDGKTYAAVCGVLQRVNKLLYVKPLRCRYEGSVGDIVVGRVVEISSGNWLLDINTSQTATLSLASISLPEQRIRVNDDNVEMQKIFLPNDLLCCEVQRVREEGQIRLHTRSARYGLLLNGLFLSVPPQLVKRQAHHIVQLSCGIQVILGVNGYIWVSLPQRKTARDTLNYASMQSIQERVPAAQRLAMARVRNIILCLSRSSIDISADVIEEMYAFSVENKWQPKELLDAGVARTLVQQFLLKNEQEKA